MLPLIYRASGRALADTITELRDRLHATERSSSVA